MSNSCPVEFNSCDETEFLSADLLQDIQPKVPEDQPSNDEEILDIDLKSSDEPRNYVAGYICRKLCLAPNKEEKINSWISVKGEGKLVEPNSELIELIARCDSLFDKFHGKGLTIGKNPLGKLETLILKVHPHFPPSVVRLFCKIKFFSRIKDLNTKLKLTRGKTSVRNLKQIGQFVN